MIEQAKTNNLNYDYTLKLVVESLTNTAYPELAYIIELLIHGNKTAFQILKDVVSQCITYWYNIKHILLFCNNFEMIWLITTYLGDESIPGIAYTHYKNIISILLILLVMSILDMKFQDLLLLVRGQYL